MSTTEDLTSGASRTNETAIDDFDDGGFDDVLQEFRARYLEK